MPNIQTQEAKIILAIKAIRTTKNITIRKAAKIYNVPRTTLSARMSGRLLRSECRPPTTKLTQLKEDLLSIYILDLDSRRFAPRLAGVEDMANYLLETRRGKRVGKLWAYRFVR